MFYTVEDFVDDLPFIRWATGTEKNAFFDELYEKYTHKRAEMDEAAEIIRAFGRSSTSLNDREVYDLWKNIKSQNSKKKKRLLRGKLKWAAIFLALLGIGSVLYLNHSCQWNVERCPFEDMAMIQKNQPHLVMADGRVVNIPSDTVKIKYYASGERVKINSRVLNNVVSGKKMVNRLVIPYGNRGQVTFDDGTKVWVNAGSQFIHPSSFSNHEREVYLRGEAYFDVSENKNKPFRVFTSELNIDVLGTSFNVCSYKEDDNVETVVVEGNVKVKKRGFHPFGRKEELLPSERVVYHKKAESIEKDRVDTRYYTSWKEGYIYLNKEKLGNIVKELTRIYNVDITIDKRISSLEFSGKLDLQEDLKSELEIISTAHPIKYLFKDNKVAIKPKSLN